MKPARDARRSTPDGFVAHFIIHSVVGKGLSERAAVAIQQLEILAADLPDAAIRFKTDLRRRRVPAGGLLVAEQRVRGDE